MRRSAISDGRRREARLSSARRRDGDTPRGVGRQRTGGEKHHEQRNCRSALRGAGTARTTREAEGLEAFAGKDVRRLVGGGASAGSRGSSGPDGARTRQLGLDRVRAPRVSSRGSSAICAISSGARRSSFCSSLARSRRAAPTSTHWSRCSTPMSCFGSTAAEAAGRLEGRARRPRGRRAGRRLLASSPVRAARARERRRGFVVARGGRLLGVAGFTVAHGKVVEIDLLMDPARLHEFELTDLDD